MGSKEETIAEFRSISAEDLLPLLSKGEVTIQAGTGPEAAGVMSAVIVNASEETAWEVLLDIKSYPKFMDAIKSARVRSHEGNEYTVRFEAGVKVMGIGGSVTYTYKLVEDRPFFNTLTTEDETVGYWAVFPAGDGRAVICHVSVSRNIMELSKILKFLVEQIPSVENGLRISPVVMMVSDMKKRMEFLEKEKT